MHGWFHFNFMLNTYGWIDFNFMLNTYGWIDFNYVIICMLLSILIVC
jgi:hypothetical protein